jgi:ATP-dependent helicase/nuclease subunit A
MNNNSLPSNTPADQLARARALDPTISFAVSAPAGSGKTSLLTQRLLTLLTTCENPEEVLAITFTRKAAGEMQDRVLQALWNTKNNLAFKESNAPTNHHELLTWKLANAVLEHDKTHGWNLLECPQRLRIQTIDSLCSSIARQLPIASGFGGQPNPTNDSSAAYRQAVQQLLAQLESETSVSEDLKRLLEHLDNNLPALENLLMALLAKRDQWLEVMLLAKHQDARLYLEAVLQDIIIDHLKATKKILQLHASELAAISDWAATNLKMSEPDSAIANLQGLRGLPKPELTELDQWLALAEILLTKEGTFRKALNKNQGFPAVKDNKNSAHYKERFGALVNAITEQHVNAAETIHELRTLPPQGYDDSQWNLLDCLTRLLPRLAAGLHLVFAELGESDFTAVSQAALTALGFEDSPSDIALQLDYRIRHILVDEFQDTSSTQLELLQKLTTGWQAGDGRSLFIVGDGMQSCYSFRNANVGIFLEARAHGIGQLTLEKLDLSVNFRSQRGLVDWVNQQFQNAFPLEDDISRGAVKYSPSNACKPELAGPAVEIYLSAFSKMDSESDQTNNKYKSESHENDNNKNENQQNDNQYLAELQEAEAIAHVIKKIHTETPDDSIALLARSRNHLQQIFPAMHRLGLSWQATDIDSLAQRMAIIDLTSLTRALLNPADRIAWLAILRAPWCGLDLHDLHRVVNTAVVNTAVANTPLAEQNPVAKPNNFPVIWQQVLLFEKMPTLSESGKQALQRFVHVIQPALATRQRKPLRKWVEGIWLALGGPATLLDAQDLNDTPTFFALLEQHQQGGTINDWHAFTNAVAKLYAAPRQDADKKLHVMTLHKSKGLEFDQVIIPRLHKISPSDGQQLMLWREHLNQRGERQLLVGPLAPIGEDKDQLYQYIQKESALQLHYETTRLFYVGCTRAIKKLYLFASLAQTDDGAWRSPPKNSLLSRIWKNCALDAKKIEPIKSVHKHNDSSFERPGLQQLLRLTSTWQAPLLNDNNILIQYRGHEVDDDENRPHAETHNAKLAQHTGSLIHRALQNLVRLSGKVDLQEWLQHQRPFWQLSLKQKGFNQDDIGPAIEKITKAVRNTLNDQYGQWLIDNAHEASACELAITHKLAVAHKEGNTIDLKLRENIIDRTFVAEGTRWIVDYKSSEPHTGQSIADFIAKETAAYTAQLTRYASCFVALGETNIKTALFFPLLEAELKFIEITLKKEP